MGDNELHVQYGIPVLYQPSHFDSLVSSFAGLAITHVTDGVVFHAVCVDVREHSGRGFVCRRNNQDRTVWNPG